MTTPGANTARLATAQRAADRAAELLAQLEAMPPTDARGMSELVARLQANASTASALSNVVQASIALATAPPTVKGRS